MIKTKIDLENMVVHENFQLNSDDDDGDDECEGEGDDSDGKCEGEGDDSDGKCEGEGDSDGDSEGEGVLITYKS